MTGYPGQSTPPTVISAGLYSITGISTAVLNLLLMFRWTTVYAVIEAGSENGYTSTMDLILMRTDIIRFYKNRITARTMSSFDDLLRTFEQVSRGM